MQPLTSPLTVLRSVQPLTWLFAASTAQIVLSICGFLGLFGDALNTPVALGIRAVSLLTVPVAMIAVVRDRRRRDAAIQASRETAVTPEAR